MSVLTVEPKYRERIVRARKTHPCDDYPHCARGIHPGEDYLLCTEFPGHDAGYASTAGHPVRMRLCCESSTFRIRTEPSVDPRKAQQ